MEQAAATLRPPSLLWRALHFYGIVTLFALGFALFSGHGKELLGTQPLHVKGLAAALGIAAGLVAVARMGARVWAPMERAAVATRELIGPLKISEIAGLALLSGCAEELLFRGALWPTLDPWGVTLLFGLVHVLPRRRLWIYPLYATAAGLFLGMLREGTGHVLPPMLAHVLINACNLWWIGRAAGPGLAPPPAPPSPPGAGDSAWAVPSAVPRADGGA